MAVLQAPRSLGREGLTANDLTGRVIEVESAGRGHLLRWEVGHEEPAGRWFGGGCAGAVRQGDLGRAGRCCSPDDPEGGAGRRLPIEDAVLSSRGRPATTSAYGMHGSSLGSFDDDPRAFPDGGP